MIHNGADASRSTWPSGRRLVLAAMLLATAGAVRAQTDQPVRILVGPVHGSSSAEGSPLAAAAPAILAEALEAQGAGLVALPHDLPPRAIEALGLAAGELPDAKLLRRRGSAEALMDAGGVRVLLLPSLEPEEIDGREGYGIELRWIDLVRGDEGTLKEEAPAGPAAIEALGRLATGAQAAWRTGWRSALAPASRRPLGEILSTSMEACAAWARARAAWNGGDPPGAVAALEEALALDPGFGRAGVDLAWIRLAQERREEAASLAEAAVSGEQLSVPALEEATIVRAAAAGDGNVLITLADDLESEGRASSRASLARAMGEILLDNYPPAIALLDPPLLKHPNDPALLHLAGIAGLGALDFYEAKERLSRAAALWPTHELILMDLAETHVRDRDLEGARQLLEAWSASAAAGEAPGAAAAPTVRTPPAAVRLVAIHMLEGHPSLAEKALETRAAALQLQGAPAGERIPILYALHEIQTWMSALGPDRSREEWLVRARSSLRRLEELIPEEEKAADPWIYDRLLARLRIRENRYEEAEEVRQKLLARAGSPGYDPAVEAEIDAILRLKTGDGEGHRAALARLLELRDSLIDRYLLCSSYMMTLEWPEFEEQFALIQRRLEEWSVNRREDALLGSPLLSAHVPIIYLIGGLARWRQGDVDSSLERYGIFLAYHRDPEPALRQYAVMARAKTAKPAW